MKNFTINYFYKTTNLINKKFYYGVRTCHNVFPGQDPYLGSGKLITKAIIKYGIKNFRKEILRVCKTKEDAFDLESWIVTESTVKDEKCYNIARGGAGRMYDNVMWINNGEVNSMISRSDLSEYEKNGWSPGKIRKELTNKDVEDHYMNTFRKMKDPKTGSVIEVSLANVPFYRFLGYTFNFKSHSIKRKSGPTANRVKVTNLGSGESKFINKNDLDKYLSNGFVTYSEYIKLNKVEVPNITIHKDEIEMTVTKSESIELYKLGWKRGKLKRGYYSRNRDKGKITLEDTDSLKRKLFSIDEAIELVKSGKWKFIGKRSYLNDLYFNK